MQNKAKLFRSMGGSPLLTIAASLLWLPLSTGAFAQSAELSQPASNSTAAVVIPQQVRYTGGLADRAGETVEAVFRIYATAEGGEALWTETQQISVSADGSYSVLLGAASESGLPQAVFAAGQARWVGVTIDRAEGVRSPLASVAYAMKAGDAESVGGVSAENLVTKDELAKLTQTGAAAGQAQSLVQAQPTDSPTGSGTADYVALWTAAGNLGNSNIFQASSGFLGIGTTTPGGPLELATGATGGANATMMLEQTSAAGGNYYANIGLYNTHGLIGNLSALGAGYPVGNIYGPNDVVFLGGQQNATTNLIFATNTGGALKLATGGYKPANERLRISAAGGVSVGNAYVATDAGAGNMIVSGKVGIGTTTPAAVLEVNGTAQFDGLVTFATGQTFPGAGGAGTITGITVSNPLTGGGTSGNVTLGLSPLALEATLNSVYAQLGAANTFSHPITFAAGQTFPGTGAGTITGITATSPLTGTGTSGNVTVGLNLATLEDTLNDVYPQLGTANKFMQPVTFDGALVSKTAYGPDNDAILAYGTNGSGGVYADSDTGYGVQGISATGTGVYGLSTSGVGVLGASTSSTGVVGTSSSGNAGNFSNAANNLATVYALNTANEAGGYAPTAVNGTANGIDSTGVAGSGTKYGVYGSTATSGGAGINGSGIDGNGGLFANNSVDYATVSAFNFSLGTSSEGPIVVDASSSGINAASINGEAVGNGSYGVFGESDGTTETGSGRVAVGVEGYAKGVDSFGVFGLASGTGSFGVFAHASGAADKVDYAPAGVYALADHGNGVEGFSVGESANFLFYESFFGHPELAGVWGDTSAAYGTPTLAGVVGTANDNLAGDFLNSSPTHPAISASNANSGGSGLFKVFKGSTPLGTCGIGDGDLSCTGQLKTLATTSGDGGRTVETYAMQSPENWMEDFGTGAVKRGVGVVQIDPAFANTVTGDASYHVFLTPRGDAEGSLYVTNVTATSFEVRESHGGKSTLSFDYRIVAKRRGYEAQRLVDVTDRFNVEQAETKRLTPDVNAVPASSSMRLEQMAQHQENLVRPAMANARPGGGSVVPHSPVVLAKPGSPSKPVANRVVPK